MHLVTGAAGFVGRRLVRRLALSRSGRVRCLIRPGSPTPTAEQLVGKDASEELEVCPVDTNDGAALRNALRGVRVVYHAAASKRGSAAAMTANTVVGTANLVKAAQREAVERFVLVSSFSVFGTAELPRGSRVDESTPLENQPQLRDPYAFSKWFQEKISWELCREAQLPLVVIRPGVIIGPNADVLVPRVGLEVFGTFLHLGGRNKLPLTYVDNCVDAIALAGQAAAAVNQAFCIVDDDLPSSRQLLRRYRAEVRRMRCLKVPYWLLVIMARCNVAYSELSRGHLPVLVKPHDVASLWRPFRFSNRKAKELLGWTPQVAMDEALEKVFSSLRQPIARGAS